MTPDFVKAVDPIVELMIDLKEQIEKNSAPPPEFIRDKFIQRITASEKCIHQRQEEWDLARYALVAWIDEQLASSLSWPGASYWNQNKLQVKFYRNQLARERFFERATEAEKLPKKDALEVFFICIVLGFKGVYDAAPGLQTPQDIGIPETMAEWVRRTRNSIKLNDVKVTEKKAVGKEHDSAPLNGKYQLLGMMMAFLVTTILASLVLYIWFLSPNRSEAEQSFRGQTTPIPVFTNQTKMEYPVQV